MRWLAAALLLLAAPALAGERFAVGPLDFAAPAGWQAEPPDSPMRRAQFAVPNPDGAAGTVSFFHFGPGRGGSAEANIERWYRQFQEPRASLGATVGRTEAGGLVVHRFRASGTFLSGRPGGPKTAMPGTTLTAAVLESPDGHVFVRFVAPTALAEAHNGAFEALIDSARRR